MPKPATVLNSKGEPIVLNAMEQKICAYNQQIVNALGFEVDLTTLTAIQKRVIEQKFFEISIGEYIPIKLGENPFSTQLLSFRSFSTGAPFAAGNLNTAAASSRMASADAGVDSVTIKTMAWGMEIGWSLMDLQFAAKSGNWDLVTAKEKARKRVWDLGIQEIAFLGIEGDTDFPGLLTQSDVTSDTTTITKYINSMTPAELDAFAAAVYEAYRSNCNRTAKPTHFVIPEADFNGLANFPDSTYPLKNRLTILQEIFRTLTMNQNFKILPCAYADQANNAGFISTGLNRYCMYNFEEDSVRMDIPVDYTATLANSINNFNFQNVGYGQYSGTKAYRPKEMLYFDFAA